MDTPGYFGIDMEEKPTDVKGGDRHVWKVGPQATGSYVSMNIKHMNIKQKFYVLVMTNKTKVLCSYFIFHHQLVESLVYD